MSSKNPEKVEFYERILHFIEEKKQTVIIAASAVIIVIGGIVAYSSLILKPKQKESVEALAKIQDYFQQDSFNLVVNGGFGLESAVEISKKYSSTKAGNLANYYAGVSYLKIGDNDNAIKFLKKYDSKGDMLTGSLALACTGDAYVEKGDFKEAIKYYEKALAYNTNELTTPVHATKALNVYIELKQYDNALRLIEKLKESDDVSDLFKENDLSKFEGYIEALTGKFSS